MIMMIMVGLVGCWGRKTHFNIISILCVFFRAALIPKPDTGTQLGRDKP